MGKFGLKNWSSPNWLKFGTGVHCYILICNLMFCFPKFLSPTFFGQTWSHILDFFKLTEIWLRGTLLHACYSFNVYFFKILFIYIFWANLVPKSEVLEILKFGANVNCFMLIWILMLIFSKFFSFIYFAQIWSQNLKFFKLAEIWYKGRLLYAYFDFDVYFFKFFVSHIFWASLVP